LQTTARVKEEAKSIFKEWQKYPDTTVAYSAYSDCGNDISAKEFSPIKLHELAIKKAWEREYDRRKMAERMTKSEAEKIANEKFKKDNSELFDSK
jgi:hypothetical protein